MISRIRVTNFKSLSDLSLSLGKVNCLVGMNGAGKTTVLQVIDFAAQLLTGEVRPWLDNRGWSVHDVNSKLHKSSNINLGLKFNCRTGQSLKWVAGFNRNTMQCKREIIFLEQQKILESQGEQYRVEQKNWQDINFIYEGSLLSQLKPSELPEPVPEFLDFIRRIRSLELLSPHLMRKRARNSDVDIGSGGEKLSAYLYEIKGEAKKKLIALLRQFYPNLVDYKVSSLRAGWKKLSVIEQFGDQKIETEANHLSDGLLRILAVLAQTDSDRSMILLDEIENGINPEIIQKLVDTLVSIPQQVLFTTHSPMILNYMDDELARTAVKFIYKNPQGESRVRDFFDIPRIGEKLQWMGPGEAFVDTDLLELTNECVALDNSENPQEHAE